MAGRGGRLGIATRQDAANLRETHYGTLPGQTVWGAMAYSNAFTYASREEERQERERADAAAAVADAAAAAAALPAGAADAAIAAANERVARAERHAQEANDRAAYQSLQIADVLALVPASLHQPAPPPGYRANVIVPHGTLDDFVCTNCVSNYGNARLTCCRVIICWPCGSQQLEHTRQGNCPYCRAVTTMEPNLDPIPNAELAALAVVDNRPRRAPEAEVDDGPIAEPPGSPEPSDADSVASDDDDGVHGSSDYESDGGFVASDGSDADGSDDSEDFERSCAAPPAPGERRGRRRAAPSPSTAHPRRRRVRASPRTE